MNIKKMRLNRLIFSSRWLQAPLYVGLMAAQAVYVYKFIQELVNLLWNATAFTETEIMLSVLGLIDIVMVANLLVMVIVGGYDVFVSRLSIDTHPDKPEWLDHVNAGTMKIKLAVSLVGISSIHLLTTFINPVGVSESIIKWQVIIHMTFVLSALLLALTDRLMSVPHVKKRELKKSTANLHS